MTQDLKTQHNVRAAADWRMIVEMIDAAMQLALEKGPHEVTPGCNCISCVNKRKRILAGPTAPWRHRL